MDVSFGIEGFFLKGSCMPNFLTALSLRSDLSLFRSADQTAIRRKKFCLVQGVCTLAGTMRMSIILPSKKEKKCRDDEVKIDVR